VSSTPVRDRTPSRPLPDRPGTASRHRKPAPAASPWRGRVARVTAAAVAGLALLVAAGPAATHWLAGAPSLAWVDQADALGAQLAASLGMQVRQQPEIVSVGLAYGYLNPLRDVSGLVPERIDMGVDFNGSGPVYAVGDAVVTNASGDNFGWPGGGWITYQLTDGPDAGLMVYVAEDITPAVQVGQHVTTSTVVGIMHEGGDGIETGWAQASGLSAESQLPEAGGIGGFGPFPTMIGANFDQLLVSLGAPAAPNLTEPASGLLPPGYPANGG
jgi:murein DD-endopeptidase MepM/ murein hydrolase activator NlpD